MNSSHQYPFLEHYWIIYFLSHFIGPILRYFIGWDYVYLHQHAKVHVIVDWNGFQYETYFHTKNAFWYIDFMTLV